MASTLDYYNKNASQFAQGTLFVDFKPTQDRFLKKLVNGAYILDFGCGSGRDTKYFLEQGYQVDATDGFAELVKMAAALKDNGVVYTSFKYGNFEGERNGRYFTDLTIESFREM